MDTTPSFEHQTLETDLHALAAEIRRNRENKEPINSSERELLKDAIRAFPVLNNKERPSAVPVPQPPSKTDDTSPLPAYAQAAAPEVKLEIEYLLDVALHQGLSKALTESEKSPYFVQDAFHDALTGKLYPELQKRGLVK